MKMQQTLTKLNTNHSKIEKRIAKYRKTKRVTVFKNKFHSLIFNVLSVGLNNLSVKFCFVKLIYSHVYQRGCHRQTRREQPLHIERWLR